MTDLIERLKYQAGYMMDETGTMEVRVTSWPALMLEAAAELAAAQKDAERMRAFCSELDAERRNVRCDGMKIWSAMCDAIGNDCDGEGMRAAIDAARKDKP